MNENKPIIKNLSYFLPFVFKNYPTYFILNIFKIILKSITPLINVIVPKYILQELIGNRNISNLILFVLIIVLSNVLANYSLYILEMRIKLINDKLAKNFDVLLNSKAMRMDFEYCEDPMINDLIEQAQRGMNYYTNGVAETMDTFSQIIANIITFSGVILIVINSKTPLLILFTTVGVILSFIFSGLQNSLEEKTNQSMIRINRRFGYFFFQLLHFKNAKDIRLYHAQQMIKDVCEEDNEISSEEFRKLSNKYAALGSAWSLYSYLIEKLLCYIILIYAFYDGKIGIPELAVLIAAIEVFSNSLTTVLTKLLRLKHAAKYQNKYIDFIQYPFKKRTGNLIPNKKIELIEFKNVSFKYPRSDNYILENINLTIDPKERLSIVGLNGAGKTTLVKLLCRLYDTTEGEILVNGINIKEYDYEEYLKLFSIVFQDFRIISFTVKENIEVLEDSPDKLKDSLQKAGVFDKVDSLPKKENTFVNKWFDKEGVEFSGGEMQKIAIARALYKDGSIVILDEPTAALDPIAEADIYLRFNVIIGQKPTIFISHRLSSCKFADRIIVLDNKKIAEEGSHNQLMNKENGVYRQMFNTQAQYYN